MSRHKAFTVVSKRERRNAFTLIELLVAMAIIALLIAILIPALGRAKNAGRSAACLSNLKQIATGFHLYAAANNDVLPVEPPTLELSWHDMLEPHLPGNGIFTCPGDLSGSVAVSSYTWRSDEIPGDLTFEEQAAASLAGRKLGDIKFSDLVMTFDSLSGWHGDLSDLNAANVDGSARRFLLSELEDNLRRPVH